MVKVKPKVLVNMDAKPKACPLCECGVMALHGYFFGDNTEPSYSNYVCLECGAVIPKAEAEGKADAEDHAPKPKPKRLL